ncbi:hypothetical protein M0R45_026196 [Rubus argutus]|uniref:HD-Zip IV C-terminal domain-containing protein n=1 Tax=Rubus argutus TaxID=59490 RepID=A0AAW1WWV1_RUBAR
MDLPSSLGWRMLMCASKTKHCIPKLTPFVESGYAFGARRWISNLQVQAERFIYSTGINTSPSDSPISPEGRRSLAITAKRMVISFCSDVCNSTLPQLVVIKQNQREEHGESSTISEIYRTDLSGNVYPPTALCMSLQPSVPGPDPRNCISVLAISRHNDILLLQECSTDETGSFVIFAPIEKADFQSLIMWS